MGPYASYALHAGNERLGNMERTEGVVTEDKILKRKKQNTNFEI